MKKTIIVFAVAFVFLALAVNVSALKDSMGTEVCGNSYVDSWEACDGSNFNGRTCSDFGFKGGTLSCSSDCSAVDTSQCYSYCANGYCYGSGAYGSCYLYSNDMQGCKNVGCEWQGSGNVCEPSGEIGARCTSFYSTSGKLFILGILGCNNNCGFDVSGCQEGINCGNGELDYGEQCEGTNFGGESCLSLNFSTGDLICKSDCTIDVSRCSNGGGEGGECGDGQTKCEGIGCVDLLWDNFNCGKCGLSCEGGDCSNGFCCGSGETYCSEANVCINLKTEFSSCGACDRRCHTGQECKNGNCECPKGQTYCSSAEACVDLESNNENCGSCGNVCSSGSCSTGICKGCGSSGTGTGMAIYQLLGGLENVLTAKVISITGYATEGEGCCINPDGCNPCLNNPDPNCGVPDCSNVLVNPCEPAVYCPDGVTPSQSCTCIIGASGEPEWQGSEDISSSCPASCVSDCEKHDETYCNGDGDYVSCSNQGTDEQSCWKESVIEMCFAPETCSESEGGCVNSCGANGGSGGGGSGGGNTNGKDNPGQNPSGNGGRTWGGFGGGNGPIINIDLANLWKKFVNLPLGDDAVGKPYTLGRAVWDIFDPRPFWQNVNNGLIYPLFNTVGMFVGYGPFTPAYYAGYGNDWEGLQKAQESYDMSKKQSEKDYPAAYFIPDGPVVAMALQSTINTAKALKPLAGIIKTKWIPPKTTPAVTTPNAVVEMPRIVPQSEIPVYVGGTYSDRAVMISPGSMTEGLLEAAAKNPKLFNDKVLQQIYKRGTESNSLNPAVQENTRKVAAELSKRLSSAEKAAVQIVSPGMQFTEKELQTPLTMDDLRRLWRANVDRMVKAGKDKMQGYVDIGKELESAMKKVKKGEPVRVKDLPKSLESLKTGELPVSSPGVDLAANYEKSDNQLGKYNNLASKDYEGLGIPRPTDSSGNKIPFGNKVHISAKSVDEVKEVLKRTQSTITGDARFKDIYLKAGADRRLKMSDPEVALKRAKDNLAGQEGRADYPNLLAKEWYFQFNQGEGKAVTIYIPDYYSDAQIVEFVNQLKQDLLGYSGLNQGSMGIPSVFPSQFTQEQINYVKNVLAEKGAPQYYPYSDANIISIRYGGEKGNYNYPSLGGSPYPTGRNNPFVNAPAPAPVSLKSFLQQMKEAKLNEIKQNGVNLPESLKSSNEPAVQQLRDDFWNYEGLQENPARESKENPVQKVYDEVWSKYDKDASNNLIPDPKTVQIPTGLTPEQRVVSLNKEHAKFELNRAIPSVSIPEGASPALTKMYDNLNNIIRELKGEEGNVRDISKLNGLFKQIGDDLSGLSSNEAKLISKDVYDTLNKFRQRGWVFDSTTGVYSRQLPVVEGAPDLLIKYDTMDAGALDFAFFNPDSPGSFDFKAKNVLPIVSPDKRVSLTMGTLKKALNELRQEISVKQISYIPSGTTDREQWTRALLYFREFSENNLVLTSYNKRDPQLGRWVWREATPDDFGADGKIKQIISIKNILELIPPKTVVNVP